MMGLQPPTKIVCVGRNYVDHATELNNPVPQQPLLFIKPPSAITRLPEIRIPTEYGECHHEMELAVFIGMPLKRATPAQALKAIAGYGVGLDLTLRQIQNELKAQGQPWERAKAFDGSCVLGPMLERIECDVNRPFEIALRVNGELRQQGSSADMIFTIADLLAEISALFTLVPGDVVLTGTPAGVAALHVGDKLELLLTNAGRQWQWHGQVEAAG